MFSVTWVPHNWLLEEINTPRREGSNCSHSESVCF